MESWIGRGRDIKGEVERTHVLIPGMVSRAICWISSCCSGLHIDAQNCGSDVVFGRLVGWGSAVWRLVGWECVEFDGSITIYGAGAKFFASKIKGKEEDDKGVQQGERVFRFAGMIMVDERQVGKRGEKRAYEDPRRWMDGE
jgi:hypothetical protein